MSLHTIAVSFISKWNEIAVPNKINIHIEIDKKTTITADKFFIELIIDNLMSNAIKYGYEHGNVFLVWDSTLRILYVKDDGIGILSHDLPFIFNRFYRADESRSSIIKGNGLGLSIVKKLCDLQSIDLLVDSKPNQGSTFSLQFPE
jgi:signal transduction histidine kinase